MATWQSHDPPLPRPSDKLQCPCKHEVPAEVEEKIFIVLNRVILMPQPPAGSEELRGQFAIIDVLGQQLMDYAKKMTACSFRSYKIVDSLVESLNKLMDNYDVAYKRVKETRADRPRNTQAEENWCRSPHF